MGRQILFDIPLPEQLRTASHLSPLKLIHKCYITYSSRAQQPVFFFFFFQLNQQTHEMAFSNHLITQTDWGA